MHSVGAACARGTMSVAVVAMFVGAAAGNMRLSAQTGAAVPRESRISVEKGSLYVREIGDGPAVIVLHGGPIFDHRYLLPELDGLADRYRLIYYDQRGRGLSADGVAPADVSLVSEIEDLELLRQHFGLDKLTLLGHSWGTELALEYAIRYPARVSRLILMNPVPASAGDYALFQAAYVSALGGDMARQKAIIASAAYKNGDTAATIARYRIHFKGAFAHRDAFERMMAAMSAGFAAQGAAGILEARAIDDRLKAETWNRSDFDVLSKLRSLSMPTVVIAGDHDFIPPAIAEHIVSAAPHARLVTLAGCGHFSYMECPGAVHRAVDDAFARTRVPPR